jgi:hypothetical protein
MPDGATRILKAEWAEEVEEKNTIFVGNVNEKKKEAWTPLEGIKSGWFICLNPDLEWEIANGLCWFWVVRVLSKPQSYVLEEERATMLQERVVAAKPRIYKCSG